MHYPSPLRRLGVVPGLVRLTAIVLEVLSFVLLCLRHDPEYEWTTSYVIVSLLITLLARTFLTKHIFKARLPDPGGSGGDSLPVRAGSRMVYLCPADFDSGRCHRRPCPGLLEGLVRAVVLARALVHNATPDRVWIVLCPTVSHCISIDCNSGTRMLMFSTV